MKILLEKGDGEEKIMMAQALLANGLVSVVEKEQNSCCKVQKSDDEIAEAVIKVVNVFGVGTQWTAVYRVLVDFCGWESDIARFAQRMNKLLHGVRLAYPCNYQSIQKPLTANNILRKNYGEWEGYKIPASDRVFSRQLFVAKRLMKLLSISPKYTMWE